MGLFSWKAEWIENSAFVLNGVSGWTSYGASIHTEVVEGKLPQIVGRGQGSRGAGELPPAPLLLTRRSAPPLKDCATRCILLPETESPLTSDHIANVDRCNAAERFSEAPIPFRVCR